MRCNRTGKNQYTGKYRFRHISAQNSASRQTFALESPNHHGCLRSVYVKAPIYIGEIRSIGLPIVIEIALIPARRRLVKSRREWRSRCHLLCAIQVRVANH